MKPMTEQPYEIPTEAGNYERLLWLSELGADVHGFSLDDFGEASHFRRLPLEIDTSFGDVRNKERVTEQSMSL